MDIYPYLFRHVILPLKDRVMGQHMAQRLSLLMESQHWDQERRSAFVDAKVRQLMEHVHARVPYYRALMKEHGIEPGDIRTASDLETFPLLEKGVVQARNDEFLAEGIDLAKVDWRMSSGSTGRQTRIGSDAHVNTWAWASMFRHYAWCGTPVGSKEVDVWGAFSFLKDPPLKSRIMSHLQQRYKLSAYQMTPTQIDEYLERLQAMRPALLRGYASSLSFLAQRALERGLRFPSIKAVSTTSDMLTPTIRATLVEAFGVPVFNQYGCCEVQGVAYECEQHDGLHVAEEHSLIRVDAPAGEAGQIIMTDLDNYSMPIINYKNGDVGIMGDRGCACGRTLPRLATIVGRTEGFVELTDGRRLNTTFFSPFFSKHAFIRNFKVTQESPDRILFRVDSAGSSDEHREMETRMREIIRDAGDAVFDYGPVEVNPRTGKVDVIQRPRA